MPVLPMSDVVGIRRRHEPGTTPAGGHGDFHLRSVLLLVGALA